MTATTTHKIGPEDGWTQVSNGSPSVTVQLQSPGPIRLKVQAAAPAADSEAGFLLSSEGDTVFAGNALAATDKCFIRCMAGQEQIIEVMAT